MKVAVECPGCGAAVEIEPGRRSAELFCARCDYPLFWVSTPRVLEDGGTGDMVLRRRPGAAGIRLPAAVPCPACQELNPVAGILCIRCGSAMEPEPEPVPVVVRAPAPPPPPPPDPVEPFWEPWMTLFLACVGVVVLGLLLWGLMR
jgi:hypothetical protein